MIRFETNLGGFTVELFENEAPISAENFLAYVDDGYFEGTVFHRVISNFMVQCGGMNEDLNRKPGRDPIKNEADNGLKNERGTLAMARTSDINSATSQFFVNLADNDFLNHGDRDFGYAVFGKISDGMDTIDKIAAVKTGSQRGHSDVPVETVVIEKVSRVEG